MTAVDWDEVKRLAADFQRAQLTTKSHSLSERNCIEIISKLTESRLLDVLFTEDGKEYITPQYLQKEIEDEIYVSGGRISTVELAKLLNVSLSHVTVRIPDIQSSLQGTSMILGQFITESYKMKLAEDVNDRLQKEGHITIGEVAKMYELPGNFIQTVFEQYLGDIIHANQDKIDTQLYFTKAFTEKNNSIVMGSLRGLTQPTQISVISTITNLSERDIHFALECLLKTNETCGTLSSSTRAGNVSFIPQIYVKQQNNWIENFYKQNGYLEYDVLSKMGITDPIVFVRKHFAHSGIFELPTCAIGSQLLDQVEISITETIITGTFVDLMVLVPTVLDSSDVRVILEEVLKKSKTKMQTHVFCDTILITEVFLQKLCQPFNDGLKEKAETAVSSGAFIKAQAERKVLHNALLKEFDPKSDRKDERRMKSTGGKSGGGTQGRETKMKSTKKKYIFTKGKGKQLDDSDSDNEPTVRQSGGLMLNLITTKEIEKELNNNELMEQLIDIEEVVHEIAKYLQPILNKKAIDLAAEAYENTLVSSAGKRKQARSNLQEEIDSWFIELSLADRGIKLFPFNESRDRLAQYLLKSRGTEIVNALFVSVSDDQSILDAATNPRDITLQTRVNILNELTGETKEVLSKLNKCINGSSIEDFVLATEKAVVSVGMLNRKIDKKKERQFLQSKREELLRNVSTEDNPANLLLVALLLIFQTTTQTILFASGKFVPIIMQFLQPQLPSEFFNHLKQFQHLVLQLLTVRDDERLEDTLKSELNDLMPGFKDVIIGYKKPAAQEKTG